MMGQLLDAVVTAIAELLPWRTFLCVGVALLLALLLWALLGDSVSGLTIFIAAGVVGLGVGLVWEMRSR